LQPTAPFHPFHQYQNQQLPPHQRCQHPHPPPSPLPQKKDAKAVDARALAADPDSFKGQNIVLKGRTLGVTQYDKYTWGHLQAQVPNRSTTESVAIELTPGDKTLLRDECIRIYGIASGTQEVTRTLTGAKNNVPEIEAYSWENIPSSNSSTCSA
jgi:hypothetical protein